MNNQKLALHIKNFIQHFKASDITRSREDFVLNLEALQIISHHLDRLDSHLPYPTFRGLVSDKVSQLLDKIKHKHHVQPYALSTLKQILRQLAFDNQWPEHIPWPKETHAEIAPETSATLPEEHEPWITFVDHIAGKKYLVRTDDGWTGRLNIEHFNSRDWRLKELKQPHVFETYELRRGRLTWSHELSLSADEIKSMAET